jgi:hypothetical protein
MPQLAGSGASVGRPGFWGIICPLCDPASVVPRPRGNSRTELIQAVILAKKKNLFSYSFSSRGHLDADVLEELTDVIGDLLIEPVQLVAALPLQLGVGAHGLEIMSVSDA